MTEEEFVRELATEYMKQGFRVLVTPSDGALPEFLKGMPVDLLLASATENVVVQVRSRGATRRDQNMPRLAAALEGRPNWRLEFMTLPESPSSARTSLSKESVRTALREAKVLLEGGHQSAALLLGWAVAEAAVRLRLGLSDSNRIQSPHALISDLFSRGEVSDESYQLLRTMMEARNATAHGFNAVTPDTGTIEAFLSVVESLLLK